MNEDIRKVKAYCEGSVKGIQDFLDVRLTIDDGLKTADLKALTKLNAYKDILKFIEDETTD